ncbi:MAG TPA: hypothetical protein VLE23_11870, partial [Geminicoccaceae bacterium]|nr:hypothetical protein [Geminicoccaceae bacterium]
MASNGWRDLGYLESYCAECHARCNGAFQVVGIAELGGVVDPDLMRDALAMLYQRHPLLRAALRRDSTAWSFIEGAPFAAVPLAIRPYE